eukprot:UN26788
MSGKMNPMMMAKDLPAGIDQPTTTRNYKKRNRQETWNIYIYKVLKQVYPEMGMSKKAMGILNSLCDDIFERTANEAGKLCKYNNKITMDARAIQTAVKLTLPGELSKHAISEATKALAKFQGSR